MNKLILLGIVGIFKEGENVKNIRKIFIILVVLVSFSFVQIAGMPSSASARWRDKGDDLPKDEGPSPILYVALAALIIIPILIVAHHNNKTTEGEKGGDDQLEKESVPDATESPGSENILLKEVELSRLDKGVDTNKKQTRIEPFVGLNTEPETGLSQNNSKDKTVVMGLTVNF